MWRCKFLPTFGTNEGGTLERAPSGTPATEVVVVVVVVVVVEVLSGRKRKEVEVAVGVVVVGELKARVMVRSLNMFLFFSFPGFSILIKWTSLKKEPYNLFHNVKIQSGRQIKLSDHQISIFFHTTHQAHQFFKKKVTT